MDSGMKSIIKQRNFPPESLAPLQTFPPIIARLYAGRGIRSPQEVARGLEHLLPPTALLGIDKAVALLAEALQKQQRFLIVGDFDADGATATAVAVRCLKALGAQQVDYIVPDRFIYGYGLTPEIVRDALPKNPDILITVDNGISSVAGVAAAKAAGIRVLITDHHLAPAVLPEADAIVNPNQAGCPFPSKALAGVGVVFYLMLALRAYLKEHGHYEGTCAPNLAQWLDILALGTVADLVPLDANNRILVQQGLARIRGGKACPGIAALLQVSGRDPRFVQASDMGFALGPRLNAAGRLEDMSVGIACLLSDSFDEALVYAQQLDQLNGERKTIEAEMQETAALLLDSLRLQAETLPLGLCLFDPSWHQGVVGILASRVKEQTHRPVICLTQISEEEVKGSARSVPGLHIRDLLDKIATQHPGLITKFGGHAMAAGLSLPEQHLNEFKTLFEAAVAEELTLADCVGELLTDGSLSENELTLTTAKLLQEAGPWGQHFPEPVFDDHFQVISMRILNEKHRKMVVQHRNGATFSAIQFNCIDLSDCTGQQVHLAYQLDINRYQGQETCQLLVRHCTWV
jgi:single-stranded-DNA-specific exonuclease